MHDADSWGVSPDCSNPQPRRHSENHELRKHFPIRCGFRSKGKLSAARRIRNPAIRKETKDEYEENFCQGAFTRAFGNRVRFLERQSAASKEIGATGRGISGQAPSSRAPTRGDLEES
jgi:hypothetical protein